MSDGAAANDEEDESEGAGGDSAGDVTPVIVTTGLVVETIEGTTVHLPCKVTVGSRKYINIFNVHHNLGFRYVRLLFLYPVLIREFFL